MCVIFECLQQGYYASLTSVKGTLECMIVVVSTKSRVGDHLATWIISPSVFQKQSVGSMWDDQWNKSLNAPLYKGLHAHG